MRLLIVEFNELCARHLCRHSQFGINLIHLIALFATWYASYGLLYWLCGVEWALAVPALLYLAILAPSLPLGVLATTALFVALVVATVLLLPQPPFWIYLIIIPLAYKIQNWSHKFYTIETDMTEFNQKYHKGTVLFVVLLFYEVPIIMNYFFFASNAALAPALQPQTAAPAKVS
jgi:hypothetical protein